MGRGREGRDKGEGTRRRGKEERVGACWLTGGERGEEGECGWEVARVEG